MATIFVPPGLIRLLEYYSHWIELSRKNKTGQTEIFLSGKSNKKNKLGEALFTKMDINYIAQILRSNFATYKGLKIDSIEKRIYEVNNSLKSGDPAFLDLSRSLQKFFFST